MYDSVQPYRKDKRRRGVYRSAHTDGERKIVAVGVVKKRNGRPVINTQLSEKQEQALELRTAGASYREIAKSLGWSSPASAQEAVKKAIAKTHIETSTEALLMDLANLDDWMKRCTHRLRTTGDLSQIDRMLRILEKKHQLLGIDSTTLAERMGKKTTAGGATIVVAPSENAFIQGMMRTMGVDPDSPEAQAYFSQKKSPSESPSKAIEAGPPSKDNPQKKAKKGKKKLVLKKKAGDNAIPPRIRANREENSPVETQHSAEVYVPTPEELYLPGQAPTLREVSI